MKVKGKKRIILIKSEQPFQTKEINAVGFVKIYFSLLYSSFKLHLYIICQIT